MALAIVSGIIMNILGCWIMWEAVVKPLRSMAPGCWSRSFPSPFYLWWAPIWLWHDLALTLIVFGTGLLGYIAVMNRRRCNNG
jgi:hypothetical protein